MTHEARIELHGTAQSVVPSAQWQAQVDELRALLTDAGLTPEQVVEDLREAFGGITFLDAAQTSWRHDGESWWRWTHGAWQKALPPPQLVLDRVELDVDATDVDDGSDDGLEPDWSPATDVVFDPTHLVPPEGITAWDEPNSSMSPAARLDPLLDVELIAWRGEGWANVRCANGWTAWVDGRLLLPAPLTGVEGTFD